MSAARGQVSDLLRPWYQKKSLTLSHEVPLDESLYSPDFASRVTEDLKTLLPFYRYFAAPLRRGGIKAPPSHRHRCFRESCRAGRKKSRFFLLKFRRDCGNIMRTMRKVPPEG